MALACEEPDQTFRAAWLKPKTNHARRKVSGALRQQQRFQSHAFSERDPRFYLLYSV